MKVPQSTRKYTPEEKQQLIKNLDIEGMHTLHLIHTVCRPQCAPYTRSTHPSRPRHDATQSNTASANSKNGSPSHSTTFVSTKKDSYPAYQGSFAA